MTKINTTNQTLESTIIQLSQRLNTIEQKVNNLTVEEENRKKNSQINFIDTGRPDIEEMKERIIDMGHELVNAFFFLLEDGEEKKNLFKELMNRFEIWRAGINEEIVKIKKQLKT